MAQVTTKLIHGTCGFDMREDGVGAFPYDCDAKRLNPDAMVYSCDECHCWTYIKFQTCDECGDVVDGSTDVLVTMVQRHFVCGMQAYGPILTKRWSAIAA